MQNLYLDFEKEKKMYEIYNKKAESISLRYRTPYNESYY